MAVLVAQHLDLDMARVDDELLDEHPLVAKRRLRLRARPRETLRHLGARMRDPHALAAAAGRGLDHHRIADLVRNLAGVGVILDHPEMAGNGRDTRPRGRLLGGDLVAHGGDRLRVRADEDNAGRLERQRKLGALGQEAITGMNGFGAGLAAGRNNRLNREVTLYCRRRTYANRLMRHRDMQRVLVGIGIDRHGCDPHPLRRPDDAAGDLAAIGDQNALEHVARDRLK